jgi:hypothetical protein
MVNIPRNITAGDTREWVDTLSDYPNDLYTLTYAIAGSAKLILTATNSGTDYKTTITGAQSGALAAGAYSFQTYVTKIADSTRSAIASGNIVVMPNLSAVTTPYDGATFAQKTLTAIQNTITAKLQGGAVERYKIHDREVWNYKLSELKDLEIYYRNLVRKEAIARGDIPNSENLYVGWNNPSWRG